MNVTTMRPQAAPHDSRARFREALDGGDTLTSADARAIIVSVADAFAIIEDLTFDALLAQHVQEVR